VLHGNVSVNDTIEIPSLKSSGQVKSMQMFHKPVNRAIQGDRVGICVKQINSHDLERGFACTVGTVPTIENAIVAVHKIKYYKNAVKTKSKFHGALLRCCVFTLVLTARSDCWPHDGHGDCNVFLFAKCAAASRENLSDGGSKEFA
jgi:selenocysteine-specific translation elongation factor